jgi:mono/diheme cytochrome c family protein
VRDAHPDFFPAPELTRVAQILVSACLVSCGNPVTADDAKQGDSVARGRSLYAHHCSHCHGFNMVTSGTVAYDLRRFPHNDKARFVNSVVNGKGNMPPWKGTLSEEQVDLLWAYVLTGGKR